MVTLISYKSPNEEVDSHCAGLAPFDTNTSPVLPGPKPAALITPVL